MSGAAGELPPDTQVGRVALRVGSIKRVRPFYEEVLGLAGQRDGDRLTLGPTPSQTLVILEEASEAAERPEESAGLFHLALRAPDRAALGDAVERLQAAGTSLSGASDHLVSEALYLRDPEGNGVELYRDRPRADWPASEDGLVGMETLPLDLDDLAAAGTGDHTEQLPSGTDVGHVHLEVTDLGRAEAFYRDALGLRLRDRYGASAAFLAAGDYHHHVGINAWNGRSAPAGDHRGLAWWELVLPAAEARTAAVDRLQAAGHSVTDRTEATVVEDPDDIPLRLIVAE